MALKSRNKVSPNFNMSSMTDIVFLLLIFFMLTSTLVSPNALKLLLPNSKAKTLEKQTISVSINKDLDFYINENQVIRKALKIINIKRLGFLVAINNLGQTTGVFTDGDLKRLMQKKRKIENLKIKSFMTKNPYVVDEEMLATDVLYQMNKKKITNVCVYKKNNKKKTIGVLHIHNLLNNMN